MLKIICTTISFVIIGLFSVSTYGAPPWALKRYYPFSGNADDASGYGAHGTLFGPTGDNTGGPALAEDKDGNADSAYDFDGTDDRIDASAIALEIPFCVSMWVNPDTPTGTQNFLGAHQYDGSDKFLFGMIDGKYSISIRGSSQSTASVTKGWQHLVMTVEEIGTASLVTVYKNGHVLWSYTLQDVVGAWGGKPLTIGQDWDSVDAATDHFDGRIDEIRIYHGYVLKPYEIFMMAGGFSATLAYVGVQLDNQDGVDGLGGAFSVTASPDGNHVYVAGQSDDAIAMFSRNVSTGALEFEQIYEDNTGVIDGLGGASSVTVSPDGNHVYVASFQDDAIAMFSRNVSTGALEFEQMYKDGVDGVDGLNGAWAVTISPDGNHVYAASNNTVAVFSRNVSTGALNYLEKHQDGVGVVDGLGGAYSVSVSPDGNHVYVAGWVDDAVTMFSRNVSTGALEFEQMYKDEVGDVDGLEGARSVTVSPDGNHVYVASYYDNAVTVFNRNISNGELEFGQAYKNGVDVVDGLGGASSVTISPDGNHVYVASYQDDAISVFRRNVSTGTLDYLEKHQDGVSDVNGLNGSHSMTMTKDGRHVYVAGFIDNAVVTFARHFTADIIEAASEAASEVEREKWDANGDGQIGLEEAIHSLQVVSGQP